MPFSPRTSVTEALKVVSVPCFNVAGRSKSKFAAGHGSLTFRRERFLTCEVLYSELSFLVPTASTWTVATVPSSWNVTDANAWLPA